MAGTNNTLYVKQKTTDGEGKQNWDFKGTIVLRPSGSGVLFFGEKGENGKQPEYALFAKKNQAEGQAHATYHVKQKTTDGEGKVSWAFIGTFIRRANGTGVLFFGEKDAEGKQPEYAVFPKKARESSPQVAA